MSNRDLVRTLAVAVTLMSFAGPARGQRSKPKSLEEISAAFNLLAPVAGDSDSRALQMPVVPRFKAAPAPPRGLREGDPELPYCPEEARPLTSRVRDRRPIGYRWLRSDGSTCDNNPSGRVYFMTSVGSGLTPPGGDRNLASYELALESREYQVRRDFLRGEKMESYSDGHDCGFQGCQYRRHYHGDCGRSYCSERRYVTDCGRADHYHHRRQYHGDHDCGVSGCSYRQFHRGGQCHCGNPRDHYHGSGDHAHWQGHYHFEPHWHYDAHEHAFPGTFYDDTQVPTGRSRRVLARVLFPARPAAPVYPWEAESFGVHFNGGDQRVELRVGAPSYQYAFNPLGRPDAADPDLFVFPVSVGPKLATPADAQGIALGLLPEGATLIIKAEDRWSRFYAGERTDLRILLKRAKRLWWDSVVIDAVLTVPAEGETRIDLNDPKWKPFLKEALERGGEYYIASWSFRRAESRISDGSWHDRGPGNRVRY